MVEHPLNEPTARGIGAVHPHRNLPLEPGIGHGAGAGHDVPADQAASPREHGGGPGNANMRGQGILHRAESGFEFAIRMIHE